MTHDEVRFVEVTMLDAFEDFLTKRTSDDVVVGSPTKDTRTVKLRMRATERDLLLGNINMNHLVTELDMYALNHGKQLILSEFNLTPTIYDPNDTTYTPQRGIMARFRMVDKGQDENKKSKNDRFKLDIYG